MALEGVEPHVPGDDILGVSSSGGGGAPGGCCRLCNRTSHSLDKVTTASMIHVTQILPSLQPLHTSPAPPPNGKRSRPSIAYNLHPSLCNNHPSLCNEHKRGCCLRRTRQTGQRNESKLSSFNHFGVQIEDRMSVLIFISAR